MEYLEVSLVVQCCKFLYWS